MSEIDDRFENLKQCQQTILGNLINEYFNFMEAKSDENKEKMNSAKTRISYFSKELLEY